MQGSRQPQCNAREVSVDISCPVTISQTFHGSFLVTAANLSARSGSFLTATGHCAGTSHTGPRLILTAPVGRYYLHFTDEQTGSEKLSDSPKASQLVNCRWRLVSRPLPRHCSRLRLSSASICAWQEGSRISILEKNESTPDVIKLFGFRLSFSNGVMSLSR